VRRALAIWAALLALLIGASPAAADVVSQGPASVAVTIYRDDAIPDPAAAHWNGYGLAMISETRAVTLPAGDTRLVLEGVADGIIAQTASLAGFPGRVLEQNFDFELLSPATLIEHSVGHEVEVSRTNPRTGKATLEPALLRSGPDGVVLDFGGRVEALGCSGDPEGLVFADVPADLTGKPTLSIRVHVDKAGVYRLRLAYMTIGLAWKAAYVARLAPNGQSLGLVGWITLANHGDVGYAGAATSVVAGRLARNAIRIVNPLLLKRESACWPQGNSHHPHGVDRYLARLMRVERLPLTVTMMSAQAARAIPMPPPPPPPRATQSDLGDYKLYTLDEPTTVAARQTKQVAFLSQPSVAFDTVQVYRASFANAVTPPDVAYPTVTTLRFDNTAAKGLGRALPAGSVAIMAAPPGGSDRFLGAHDVRDVPVGEPFELEIGQSHEVTVRDATLSVSGGAESSAAKEIIAINASARPATVEIRQPQVGRDFRIAAESTPHGLKSGDPIWRVTLAPGATETVTYTYAWKR
jgi:hypothetical protein